MTLTKRKLKKIIKEEVAKQYSFQKPFGPEYKNKKFNFEKFMNLATAKERLDYAAKTSEKLGFGSSRVTYKLSGTGKVLKIAVNLAGVEQNKAELQITKEVSDLQSNYMIVTKIFGHDNISNPTLLIAEEVFKITVNDFKKNTGLQWNKFLDYLDDEHPEHKIFVKYPNNEFLLSVNEALTETSLISNDLTRIDHWGITEDNRIVILDYGYNEHVDNIYNDLDPNNKFFFRI